MTFTSFPPSSALSTLPKLRFGSLHKTLATTPEPMAPAQDVLQLNQPGKLCFSGTSPQAPQLPLLESEAFQLSEQLKNAPHSPEGQSALDALLKDVNHNNASASWAIARALSNAAQDRETWRVMQPRLFALLETHEGEARLPEALASAFAAIAKNKHTWPEIYPALHQFAIAQRRNLSPNPASAIMGEMAAQHEDIRQCVESDVLEGLKPGQPAGTRTGMLMVAHSWVVRNPAAWETFKKPVLKALQDNDFKIQLEALFVLGSAAHHPQLRQELLPIIIEHTERLAESLPQRQRDVAQQQTALSREIAKPHLSESLCKPLQERLEHLRRESWDLQPATAGTAGMTFAILQSTYALLAREPNGWKQIAPHYRKVFEENGLFPLRVVKHFVPMMIAAAQYPHNWEGGNNLQKQINWLFKHSDSRVREAVAKAVIKDFSPAENGHLRPDPDYFWEKFKPVLRQWLKDSPQRRRERKEDYNTTEAFLKAADCRIQQNRADWEYFRPLFIANGYSVFP